MKLYAERPRWAQLEKRTTSYRFDLETSPAWSRIDEPGIHAPTEYLRAYGIDTDLLGDFTPEFDWLHAATMCETFEILERGLIEFAEDEADYFAMTASMKAFAEEEAKHILLFERYREAVVARHDRDVYERYFAPVRKRLYERRPQVAATGLPRVERHYLGWMNAVFFEEYSIWIDAYFAKCDDVQPTWKSVHRLHRIEEVQHVATDEAHLDSLELDPDRRNALSQHFVMSILKNYLDTVALAASIEYARDRGPGDVLPEGQISARPFIQDLVHHPAFRRTRAGAPYFVKFAEYVKATTSAS